MRRRVDGLARAGLAAAVAPPWSHAGHVPTTPGMVMVAKSYHLLSGLGVSLQVWTKCEHLRSGCLEQAAF